MNTSLANRAPQLLVDLETGRVLRGDDAPVVSQRWLDSHTFIEQEGGTVFAGPDARRAAAARRRGESTAHLDVYEYEVHSVIAGFVHLQRKVEED